MAKKKKEREFTVAVDTREKTPLWDIDDKSFFITHQKVDAGDYAFADEDLQHLITIERKKTFNELYANFTKHRKRFYDEVERMKKFKRRFIVIEQNAADAMNAFSYRTTVAKRSTAIAIVLSSMINLMLLHDIHVIFAGDHAKSVIRQLFVKTYEYHKKGKL
jgi:hypothetical protein